MEKLKINETPVRTSRNFNINNIKLENINFPKDVKVFNNAKIKNETSDIFIEEKAVNTDVVYGLGDVLVNQTKNSTLKISTKNNQPKEVKIDYLLDKENPNLIEAIEIIAAENSRATIILNYESEGIEVFHNGIIKCKLEENSNLNVIILNLINEKSNNFLTIQNELNTNANLKFTIVDFGGKNSITNYYSDLRGNLSENTLQAIYIGRDERLIDLNYIGELRGEKSIINIEVQGALKDKSKKHFKGTIDFKKGCKKAKGSENENCMLLSDTAHSIALPMLLCSEEDVEGEHSTSAGKVGEKELFYIMSRGFNQKEAMKLMVKAKFNKILESIKDDELRNEIISEVDKRLD